MEGFATRYGNQFLEKNFMIIVVAEFWILDRKNVKKSGFRQLEEKKWLQLTYKREYSK